MYPLLRSRLGMTGFLALSVVMFLANNGNPPNGRTGAPFDGHCNNCHSGNSNGYDGTVTLSGLPASLAPNTTYPITLNINVTQGNPVKAGFQIVMVDASNNNVGTLNPVNNQTGVDMAGGRRYLEQRNGKNFSGGAVSWDFEWTSPASVNGNIVRAYFIGNFCNGNGGTSGDFAKAFNETFSFAGAPPLVASISAKTDVSCNGGADGSATVSAVGGNPPYSYLWSNGQTGQTAVNLAAGNYTVTVSAGGATATASVSISQPSALNVTAAASNIITCAQPSATLSVSAGGGVQPYNYAWSNGGFGQQITVTSPGVYSVLVTDANGCTKSAQTTVTANTAQPSAVAAANQPITCIVSSVTLSGAGSSQGAQFSYMWNGPGIVSGANTLSPTVNQAGIYTLTVTNASNGCTNTAAATVMANLTPPGAMALGGTLTCIDTIIMLQGSSNAPNASYAWTGPNGFASMLQNPIALQPGTYTLATTSPDNGCTSTANAIVAENTIPPSVSAQGGALTCTADSVILSAVFTPGAATLLWSGPNGFISNEISPIVTMPGVYQVVAADPLNGCTSIAETTVTVDTLSPLALAAPPPALNCNLSAVQIDATASSQGNSFSYQWSTEDGNIAAGANTLTPVVDAPGVYVLLVGNTANGCTAQTQTSVQQTTPPLAEIAAASPIACFGGQGVLSGSGSAGSAPYAYLWSSGDTLATTGPLSIGVYTLTLTDADGCTASAQFTLTQPELLQTAFSATPESGPGASDGTAEVVPSGGVPPYAILWNTSDTTFAIIGLAPDVYAATITDANGCTSSGLTTVNAFECALSATLEVTPIACAGQNSGAIQIVVLSGDGPFSYSWNTGDTTAFIDMLGPGTYVPTITEANGCTFVLSTALTSPPLLAVNVNVTPLSANGSNDGSAIAEPTGGTPSYTFLWDNNSETAQISGLAPGAYTVTVTDANGCTDVETAVISPFNCNLSVTFAIQHVRCFGQAEGAITPVPVGGTLPYSFVWCNAMTTPGLTNMPAGVCPVTITDANGCVVMAEPEVLQPDTFVINVVGITPASCVGSLDGAAIVEAVGGTPPYTFSPNQPLTNLPAGNYSYAISDANGCLALLNFTIPVGDSTPPQVVCPEAAEVCAGSAYVFPMPIVSDNCALGPNPVQQIAGLPSGSAFPEGETLQVFVASDQNGNTASCSFTVMGLQSPMIVLQSVQNDVNNSGQGGICVELTNLSANQITLFWLRNGQPITPPLNTLCPDNLFEGTYSLLVVNSLNGCSASLSAVVENTVGVADAYRGPAFTLAPNPASEFLHLRLASAQTGVVEVFDAMGRLAIREALDGDALNISVGRLTPGAYVLRLLTPDRGMAVRRWIKQ